MDVQCTLAVGNFPAKDTCALTLRGDRQRQHACHPDVRLAFHNDSFLITPARAHCGTTVNFRCMPSCSSLQITVQTASYSPGSLGAVSRNSCMPGLNNKSHPSTLLRSLARSSVKP